jgi:hypothetical protein
MKQFTCFLKSNHKIKEKSLATFFKLDWPKNTLTSIKIIFENFVKTIDIEMKMKILLIHNIINI